MCHNRFFNAQQANNHLKCIMHIRIDILPMHFLRVSQAETATDNTEERSAVGHGLPVFGRAVRSSHGELGSARRLRRTRCAANTCPAEHDVPFVRKRVDGQNAVRPYRKNW